MKARFDDDALLIRIEPHDRQYPLFAAKFKAIQNGDHNALLALTPPVEAQPIAPSIETILSHDIHNRRAQGILNRSMKAAKNLTAQARKDLEQALKTGINDSGRAILQFIDKYRVQLGELLTSSQLAAVLEGAREIVAKVPAIEAESEELGDIPQPTFPIDDSIHLPIIDNAAKDLAQRNILTRNAYDTLDSEARVKAFTVANVDAESTLTKIRDALADNVKEGADYETFKTKVLDAVDAGSFLSETHLETVFRTNVQTAFSEGQLAVLQNPLVQSGFPYSAYDSIHDARAREEHNALDRLGIGGTNVYRNDDPVFQLFRPPWDYNCRCSWTPLTVAQAAERGIDEAKKWEETGEAPTNPTYVPMPAFQPPEGFTRAVASAPLSIQLSMRPIQSFYDVDQYAYGTAMEKEEATITTLSEDEYPRDSLNRFVPPMIIAEVACCSEEACEELRETLPEKERAKFDRAVSILQNNGAIHHPKQPSRSAIDINGRIVDREYRWYVEDKAVYDEWVERYDTRKERKISLEMLADRVRDSKPTACITRAFSDSYDKLRNITITDLRAEIDEATKAYYEHLDEVVKDTQENDVLSNSDVRAIERLRYGIEGKIARRTEAYVSQYKKASKAEASEVETDRLWDRLEDMLREVQESSIEFSRVVEDAIEECHKRLDEEEEYDREPDAPEEPIDSIVSLSIEQDEDRAQILSEILLLLFDDKEAEQMAHKIVNGEFDGLGSMAFSSTPKVTKRYGKQPGPGWVSGGTSKSGTPIWLWGANPNAGASSQSAPTPPPQAPQQPSQTQNQSSQQPQQQGQQQQTSGTQPTANALKHRQRLQNATNAYNAMMGSINAGTPLTQQQKTGMVPHLTVLSMTQLRALHSALGGTAQITGTQRTPWAAAIRAILNSPTSAAVQPQTQTAQTPPQAPVTPPATPPAPPPQAPVTPQTPPVSATPQVPTGQTTKQGALAKPTAPTKQKFIDLDTAQPVDYKGKNGAQIDPTWSGLDYKGVAPKYGAIVTRKDPATGKVQVLLAKPANYFGNTSWTWAKGTQDAGNDAQTTAMNEAMEEVGASGDIVGHLTGTYTENSKSGLNAYFIMKQKGNIDDAAWQANGETKEIKWVDIDQADQYIVQTAQHTNSTDPNGAKKPSFVNWQRDADVLEQAKAALIPGYTAKVNRRVDVLDTHLQQVAGDIRATVYAMQDGLITQQQAQTTIDGLMQNVSTTRENDIAGAMRSGGSVKSADLIKAVVANDPGHPVKAQSPPGPPPRPGLVWNPQTHRWILPPQAPTSVLHSGANVITGKPAGGNVLNPANPNAPQQPITFWPPQTPTGPVSNSDRTGLETVVGAELQRLGIDAKTALQNRQHHSIYSTLKSKFASDVGAFEVERTLKNLYAQQTTVPIPAQFDYMSTGRGPNYKLPNETRPTNLTQSEIVALQKWTSSIYSPFNRALLTTDGNTPLPGFEQMHTDMQSAFAKAQTFSKPVPVERVLNLQDPAILQKFIADAQTSLKTGQAIRYPGYQATATDPISLQIPRTVVMKINAVNGIDMGPHHHHPHCKEILLNNNSQFKVTGIKQVGGVWEVSYDQVMPGMTTAPPPPVPAKKASTDFPQNFWATAPIQGFLSGNIPMTTPIPGGGYGAKKYTLFNELLKETGRDTKPEVKTSAEIDALGKKGWKIGYRGTSSKKFSDMLRNDDNYEEGGSGLRAYGTGIYFANGSGETQDKSDARGYGSAIVRFAVDPSARVVTYSQALKDQQRMIDDLKTEHSAGRINQKDYQKRLEILNDVGCVAVLNNYDMIDAKSQTGNYNVLLNRSKIIIQDTDV